MIGGPSSHGRLQCAADVSSRRGPGQLWYMIRFRAYQLLEEALLRLWLSNQVGFGRRRRLDDSVFGTRCLGLAAVPSQCEPVGSRTVSQTQTSLIPRNVRNSCW
ncbi:hypothetical protein BaRGS_00010570 [Batillaria attramentaria]|uniref:Uncharacterized protein n=1 Tax=Batillaria attramentaria TaxID=370345 RepID=A0ABD0LG30_9CAEN